MVKVPILGLFRQKISNTFLSTFFQPKEHDKFIAPSIHIRTGEAKLYGEHTITADVVANDFIWWKCQPSWLKNLEKSLKNQRNRQK